MSARIRLFLIACAWLLSGTTAAQTAPFTVKFFGAASIGQGKGTTLDITVNNTGAVNLTGVTFTDTFPAGLVVSTPNGQLSACTPGSTLGAITAVAGSGSVALGTTTVLAGGACTVQVNVTGTTAGTKVNSVTASDTVAGAGNTATASIDVIAPTPPFDVKFFGAGSVGQGENTTLDITVNNTGVADLNGVTFTDTFPAGLVVSTPNGQLSACTPGSTLGAITAVAGSGSVALGTTTVLAGGACTVQVNVTGTTAGTKINSVTASDTVAGAGNTATASIDVIAPTAPFTVKFFGAATVGIGGSTTLDITLNNTGAADLTGATFTDTFPAGLVVATPNGQLSACTPGSTLGAITAVAGSGSVALAASKILVGGACTVQVNVTGVTAGVKVNSVTPSDVFAGAGNTATASLTVLSTVPPTIVKNFGSPSILQGGIAALTFTLTNPNAAASQTGVGFTDTFPAGLVVATPNGLTGSCGGGTISATAGSGSVSLSGATLAAAASCTFSVNVTSTVFGAKNNVTGPVTSVEDGAGGTASSSLAVLAPTPSVVPVPALSALALAGLSLLLAGLGWLFARKR